MLFCGAALDLVLIPAFDVWCLFICAACVCVCVCVSVGMFLHLNGLMSAACSVSTGWAFSTFLFSACRKQIWTFIDHRRSQFKIPTIPFSVCSALEPTTLSEIYPDSTTQEIPLAIKSFYQDVHLNNTSCCKVTVYKDGLNPSSTNKKELVRSRGEEVKGTTYGMTHQYPREIQDGRLHCFSTVSITTTARLISDSCRAHIQLAMTRTSPQQLLIIPLHLRMCDRSLRDKPCLLHVTEWYMDQTTKLKYM